MIRSCVKRTAMQDSAIQNIRWKYLPSDVSIISVHWRKDIYSGRTEKPTEWLTECIYSNQKKDLAIKRLRVRTISHWRHQSASNEWLTEWQYTSFMLVDHEIKD